MRWSDWLALGAAVLSIVSSCWIVGRGNPTARRTDALRRDFINLLEHVQPSVRCIHGEKIEKPCPQCGEVKPEEKRRL